MVRISNNKVIEILMKNSRTPYLKIAEKFGVSETAIRKKVKKLEKEGIIKRFTIELDPKKIGYKIVALIGIDTKPEAFISVIDELKRMKEIKNLYSSSGDHMIMFEYWGKDSKELSKLNKKLKKIPGITKICPAILLEKIK